MGKRGKKTEKPARNLSAGAISTKEIDMRDRDERKKLTLSQEVREGGGAKSTARTQPCKKSSPVDEIGSI